MALVKFALCRNPRANRIRLAVCCRPAMANICEYFGTAIRVVLYILSVQYGTFPLGGGRQEH
jgi:hypothetical protein